jgi:hypothetical protein
VHDIFGLPELPAELKILSGGKTVEYWKLYKASVNGDFPTYRASGRIFVRRADLPLIAQAFGLKVKP